MREMGKKDEENSYLYRCKFADDCSQYGDSDNCEDEDFVECHLYSMMEDNAKYIPKGYVLFEGDEDE